MFTLQLFSKLDILLRASLELDLICDTVVLVPRHRNKRVCTLEKLGYLFKESYCSQIDQGGRLNHQKLKPKEKNQNLFLLGYMLIHP